jgi:hypothetical protein
VTGLTAAATLVLERALALGNNGQATGLALAGMALALGTLGQWGLVVRMRLPRRLTARLHATTAASETRLAIRELRSSSRIWFPNANIRED